MSTILIMTMCFISILSLMRRKYALAIFDIIWVILSVIAQNDLARSTFSQTKEILTVMIISVNIGYFMGNVTSSVALHTTVSNNKQDYFFDEKFLFKIIAISALITTYYGLLTVSRFGFNMELIRMANNSNSSVRVFSGLIDTLLFFGIAQPFIYVAILSISFNFFKGFKTPRKHIILIAYTIVMSIVVRAGRTILIQVIMCFVASVVWDAKTKNKHFKTGNIVIIAVVLYAILNLVTKSRNASNITFMEQAFSYFEGAIAHMNMRLKNVDLSKNYYGYVTYGGFLYYPVKIIQTISNSDILTSNEIMFFLQERVIIYINGVKSTYNALLPNAYYYYFDSGYAGVVLFSAILGFVSGRNEEKYKNDVFTNFVLWASCIYAIGYSAYGGIFWNFDYATGVIFCYFLKNHLYKKLK